MTNEVDRQYIQLLEYILRSGYERQDRTGVGAYSVFSHTMKFDLNAGFPIITTKKIHFRSIVHELLWFIKGDTNLRYLKDNNIRIWDEWQNDMGVIPYSYPYQWRTYAGYVDQIRDLIEGLGSNPYGRRHIITAWNPSDIPYMTLPPCHILCQFFVENNRLHSQMYQRSADAFLGLPFNISSYSLLTHMIAQVCDMNVGSFNWVGGDVHLYTNHREQAQIQTKRQMYQLPTLHLNPSIKCIDDFCFDDIVLKNYMCGPAIKGEVAV